MLRRAALAYHLVLLKLLFSQLSEQHLKGQVFVHVQDSVVPPCIQLRFDLIIPGGSGQAEHPCLEKASRKLQSAISSAAAPVSHVQY